MENIIVYADEVGSVLLLVAVIATGWWTYIGIKKLIGD